MKSILIFLFTISFYINSTAQDIWVGDIENKVIAGPALGNRDLSFGVRNILEELLQDRGYSIYPNSTNVLSIEIMYFDVQKTSVQLGGFSKNLDITEIIFRATIIKNGKKLKPIVVKGQAKSISTSTLIIDQGGKFSQADVSTALKKVCEEVLTKFEI
jgi:uncharacterized lipoprotein YajG